MAAVDNWQTPRVPQAGPSLFLAGRYGRRWCSGVTQQPGMRRIVDGCIIIRYMSGLGGGSRASAPPDKSHLNQMRKLNVSALQV